MRKILLVIDMQNDFIDGALGTKEAVAIVPKVVDEIKKHQSNALDKRKRNKRVFAYSYSRRASIRHSAGTQCHVRHLIRTTQSSYVVLIK